MNDSPKNKKEALLPAAKFHAMGASSRKGFAYSAMYEQQ
jgi:hypothetical protein